MLIKCRIMEFMTVDEVQEGLKVTKTVIVPMGVIEQHGYHLPLSVDVFNCTEVAKRVSEKTGCFVAPPINYSFSGGELPGTFNINPSTLSLYLSDILKSLVVMGMKKILVLLGHGGTENRVATDNAIDMFMRLNPEIKDIVFATAPAMWFSKKYSGMARDDKDYHAGWSETSRMLYWQPKLVKLDRMVTDSEELMELFRTDQDAYQVKTKLVDDEFVFPSIRQDPRIEVGVMGNPAKASKELGEAICIDVVNNVVDFLKKLDS